MDYLAKLDDFDLVLTPDIEDRYPGSIAVYTYPFVDGAAMDYMGEEAREVSLETVWNRATYSRHIEFLSHIRSGLIYELVHPKYGVIKGRIFDIVSVHNEAKNRATVKFLFKEQKIGEEITPDFNVSATAITYYKKGVSQNLSAASNSIENTLGGDSKTLLSKTLDASKKLSGQITAVSGRSRRFLADLDRQLGVLGNIESMVAIPLDAVVNTVDFGTRLPGRIISPVTRTVARIAIAKNKITTTPARFLSSFNSALTALKSEVKKVSTNTDAYTIVEQSIDVSASHTASLVVAELYEKDELLRSEYDRTVNLETFDIEGTRIATVESNELLNVRELENSLYVVRRMLGNSYVLNREILTANRFLAESLERHVSKVKLNRDKIVSVDLGDTIIPLHTLLLVNGLPDRYFEKVMAINNIANPTFVSGKVDLYDRP